MAAGRGHAALLALLCALSFPGLGRSLWTPDEPREAEIAREMWLAPSVIPTLNGRAFIEKPLLYYRSVAATFAATGGPTPAAARAVSAAASALTLLLVYLWGRRACSASVGLLASAGLATSLQFAQSAHWVLIDPLLMLFTTAAALGAWQLVAGDGRRARAVGLLYGGLGAALWVKGFIGPVLLIAGLAAFALLERSTASWRAAYSTAGLAGIAALFALLPAALFLEGGAGAVREWFWVNRVERFLHPQGTGHEKPFHYYLWMLPLAVLPWLMPLLDGLRPGRWRSAAPHGRVRRFWAAQVLGMLLVLSASVTKRGTYLLPMLPMLSLLLAAHTEQWWAVERRAAGAMRSPGWWLQLLLCAAFALAPISFLLWRFGSRDPLALGCLVTAGVIVATLVVLSVRGAREAAALALLASAVVSVGSLALVAPRIVGPHKDMIPYVEWVGRQLPPGEPVYASGVDETLKGIVPFATGRHVVALERERIGEIRPEFLLVQDGAGPPAEGYRLLGGRGFGPGRHMALWRRP